jgi:hypothetical protein
MSDQTLSRALHARLATLSYSPQPQIDWGNATWTDTDGTSYDGAFKPNAATAWIRPKYLPVENRPISTNPIQHHTKLIYAVDCRVPERRGDDAAYALADAVSEHFFPATNETYSLTAGSFRVHINNRPDKTPLQAQGGFVGVAVLIRCFALT